MIVNELISVLRVPDGLMLSADTYCQLLQKSIDPGLKDKSCSCMIYRSLGFVYKTLMVWPQNSPDLNQFDNLLVGEKVLRQRQTVFITSSHNLAQRTP